MATNTMIVNHLFDHRKKLMKLFILRIQCGWLCIFKMIGCYSRCDILLDYFRVYGIFYYHCVN